MRVSTILIEDVKIGFNNNREVDIIVINQNGWMSKLMYNTQF